MAEANLSDNPVAYFWRTYLEWRAEYGVGDVCMGELVAAMRVELQGTALAQEQVLRLRRLIQIIESEVMVMNALRDKGVAKRFAPTARW